MLIRSGRAVLDCKAIIFDSLEAYTVFAVLLGEVPTKGIGLFDDLLD